jgi:AraC-like DNA-binding protein
MSHDTLSDVLRTVRLKGAVFFYVSGGREWAAESPASRDIAATVMPGAEHVMQYHVVTSGSCWAGLVGEPPVRVGAGDAVLFPHGDGHVLSSAPGLRTGSNAALYYDMKLDQVPLRVTYEGLEGPSLSPPQQASGTTIVCGFISCDVKPFNPLMASLPRMLALHETGGGNWGAQFLQHAVAESNAPRMGSEAMLARMSEMLFVDAVRRHVETLAPEGLGWLAGLRDRFVGKALSVLHERPAQAWTMDELSREAGLSRSALHERFVQLIGQPPMQYLAHWRMQLASGLLRSSNSTVAAIALEVGYDSEAAFARAFKRLVGMPPAAWRRAAQEGAARKARAPVV